MPDKSKILIVDDDREIARGLSIRLRAAGYDVSMASDGRTGIEMANSWHPNAILLDIRMPVMDGFEVIEELKQRPETAGIPIIVVSANVVEETRARALGMGAAYFLEKPFHHERILSAVAAAVESGAGLASAATN